LSRYWQDQSCDWGAAEPWAKVEVADKRLGRISGDTKTEERGPPDSMQPKHLSSNNSGSK